MSHHIRQAPESSKWAIGEMEPSDLKNTLAAQLAEKLANDHPLKALQWSESLQDEKARNAAIEVSVHTLTEQNPDEALQYAMSASDPQLKKQMLYDVGFVMAGIDPNKASNTLELFSEETRTRLIPRIAWSMSQKDPDQTIQWVEQIPQGSTRDEAIREASWGLVSADPEQAFRLVSTVDDSAMRYSLVRDALIAWHRVDPERTHTPVSNIDVAKQIIPIYTAHLKPEINARPKKPAGIKIDASGAPRRATHFRESERLVWSTRGCNIRDNKT